jgi:hypothetical protein
MRKLMKYINHGHLSNLQHEQTSHKGRITNPCSIYYSFQFDVVGLIIKCLLQIRLTWWIWSWGKGEYRCTKCSGNEGGHGGVLVFTRTQPRGASRWFTSHIPLEIQTLVVVSWLLLLLLRQLPFNLSRMLPLENSSTKLPSSYYDIKIPSAGCFLFLFRQFDSTNFYMPLSLENQSLLSHWLIMLLNVKA